MNGLTVANQNDLPQVGDVSWEVTGFGDYDGDGRGDIPWRNPATGTMYLWTLNGFSVATQGFLPSVAGSNWMPVK